MKKTILSLISSIIFVTAIVWVPRTNSFVRAEPAPTKKEIKYSLAIYHYNLEYVAGDTAIENKIITESLDPMLDFFLKHPTWGADFEMQAYMALETSRRYPAIFEKLKKLVASGQINLVCFHYADQLFLAYPRHDMEWSDRLTRKTLDDLGLKRAGAVFSQEGQFGEGMAAFMADQGYTTIALPKNLFRYAHGEKPAAPYYELNGVNVIQSSKGIDYDDGRVSVKVSWSYMNDAELLPTGATPYSQYFKYKPETLEKYENELLEAEKSGYRIGTIDQYIADVKAAGVKPAKLKPMIDGDWQPKDTENIFRWMGNYLGAHERDNEILTENVRVRHRLLAAEVLIKNLKYFSADTAPLEADLAEAWRLQSHATVSDATGWTPFPIEIKYSQTNSAAADALVTKIVEEGKKILGSSHIIINTAYGSAETPPSLPAEPELKQADCPGYTLTGEIEKQLVRCFQVDAKTVRMDLKFKTTNSWKNDVRLAFPRKADYLLFSPSLMEDKYVLYNISEFTPEDTEFYLPSSNGLIALEDGLFLIKKTDTVHVAYRFAFDKPEISLGMNKPPSKTYLWTLYLFRGTPEEAVTFADSINVHPVVVFQ